MEPNPHKIFISYRRDGGSEMASLIANSLAKKKKWTVFFDVKTLEAGRFDSALLQNLKQSKHFVLVLTKGALNRCIEDKNRGTLEDWVHKEIVAALKLGLNIIPLLHHEFKWPPEGDLPEDMRVISLFNGIPWSHTFQEAAIDKIEKFIEGANSSALPNGHNYDDHDYNNGIIRYAVFTSNKPPEPPKNIDLKILNYGKNFLNREFAGTKNNFEI